MTVGDKQYNERDLLRMQREAEARVREMQARARRTVEEGGPDGASAPRGQNRNWVSTPNYYRQRMGARPTAGRGQRRPSPPRQAPPDPDRETSPRQSPPEPDRRAEESAAPPAQPQKSGTIVGDIMDALGLDEDYLLIIGLMLILINQRADTTLILALAYLLI